MNYLYRHMPCASEHLSLIYSKLYKQVDTNVRIQVRENIRDWLPSFPDPTLVTVKNQIKLEIKHG
jgi:hypothetical protein